MGVTVGDVRKAIAGLPDAAPILTGETFDDGAADVMLDLISFVRDGGIVRIEIVVSDPEADMDDDLDDETPCPWCGCDPCDCAGDDRDSYREDP